MDKVRQVDDLHFHCLRHHLASLLIESGCDVKTVQARLRHACAKTTLHVYGHLWPEKDETTREAIGGVIAARRASHSGDPAGGLRAKQFCGSVGSFRSSSFHEQQARVGGIPAR